MVPLAEASVLIAVASEHRAEAEPMGSMGPAVDPRQWLWFMKCISPITRVFWLVFSMIFSYFCLFVVLPVQKEQISYQTFEPHLVISAMVLFYFLYQISNISILTFKWLSKSFHEIPVFALMSYIDIYIDIRSKTNISSLIRLISVPCQGFDACRYIIDTLKARAPNYFAIGRARHDLNTMSLT